MPSLSCCRRRTGYRGGIEDGIRHGYGVLRLSSGSVYSGEWFRGEMSGEGEWVTANQQGRYVGQWCDNRMSGAGELDVASGAHYTGGWSQGFFHNEGELRFSDGTVYRGEFRKGREHGLGTLTSSDGKVYEGQWAKGEAHGYGSLTYPDGKKQYKGAFRHSKPHGSGKLTYADGVSYVGQWQYGAPAGQGSWRNSSGDWLSLGEVGTLGRDDGPTPLSSVQASPRTREGLPLPDDLSSLTDSGSEFSFESRFEPEPPQAIRNNVSSKIDSVAEEETDNSDSETQAFAPTAISEPSQGPRTAASSRPTSKTEVHLERDSGEVAGGREETVKNDHASGSGTDSAQSEPELSDTGRAREAKFNALDDELSCTQEAIAGTCPETSPGLPAIGSSRWASRDRKHKGKSRSKTSGSRS